MRAATAAVVTAAPARLSRQAEIDDLHRADVVDWLSSAGVRVDGKHHTLDELVNWRDRIQAAEALRVHFNVYLDWQTLSLTDLVDIRLRAAKAAHIESTYGIRVEWNRYSWGELEDLRRHVNELSSRKVRQPPSPPMDADGLAIPKLGEPSPSVSRSVARSDPDAILEPSFRTRRPAASAPTNASSSANFDPDAVLPPTFANLPKFTNGRRPSTPWVSDSLDNLIDPWEPPH